MTYAKQQRDQDTALLVYAFRVNGPEGFRKECSRLILERDLTLTQADKLLRGATKQLVAA